MSAPAPEVTPAAGTADVVDPAVPAANAATPTDPPPAQEPDWKAQARKWEDQAKANKKAADELQKLKDGQKTAEQKLADEAAQAKKDLEDARAETLRYRAAATHHVSESNFDLLGTGDEAAITERAKRVGALEAAAAELATLKAAQAQAAQAANTPGAVPALTPGAPGVPDTSYPANWFPGLQVQPPTN